MSIKNNSIKSIFTAIVILLSAWSIVSAENSSASDSLNITPDLIRIGTTFHGTDVEITAEVGPCDGAVIVLEGNEKELTLNRKGRIAVIWMNVAQLTISGMPEVYIMASSGELDDISSREQQSMFRLGEESLRPQMEIKSDKPLTGEEFEHFIMLKSNDGTYDTNNRVSIKTLASGNRELSSTLKIPSKMPPGDYEVHLYCFQQKQLVVHKSAGLKIERAGLPEFMIDLAYNHAALYGLMAVGIAMAIGLIMGFIFSSLPGKEH